MPPKIAIAMSGGVDSLIAAYLLKKKGNAVFGIHFLNGFENNDIAPHLMQDIADQVQVPLKIIDIKEAFYQKVILYFVSTYQKALTPNPCIICNQQIKFGVLLEIAEQLGADQIATGHYAQLKTDCDGTVYLKKARDILKDQSYFLSFLNQNQLRKACFPLGKLLKKNVKKIAQHLNFKLLHHKESQDICFIRNQSYAQFLENQPQFRLHPGEIVTANGQKLGHHSGLHNYTIGQRKGINCPGNYPYYVLHLDGQANKLLVGHKKDLLKTECVVHSINYINTVPRTPRKVLTRIRYRHQEAPSMLVPISPHKAIIKFFAPIKAIAPGQAAVFYDGTTVFGGGFILE